MDGMEERVDYGDGDDDHEWNRAPSECNDEELLINLNLVLKRREGKGVYKSNLTFTANSQRI